MVRLLNIQMAAKYGIKIMNYIEKMVQLLGMKMETENGT